MAQRFTKEFEEEAVRLVRTSGRAKRETAGPHERARQAGDR